MIENIENFRAELNVESLGNPLDVIVLEQGEVQRSHTWTNQHVASRISSQVEAWQSGEPASSVESRILRIVDGDLVAVGIYQTPGHGIAVCVPESHVGRSRNLETLSLDVVRWIPGIRERLAARAS